MAPAAGLAVGIVFSLAGTCVSVAATPLWDLGSAVKLGDSLYSVGRVAAPSREISGIVLSRKRANQFWAIQDAGSNDLFAFDASGRLTQEVAIRGMESEDLEDMAADNDGNLYLADTGTNLGARDEVIVHRIPEPGAGDTEAVVGRSWRLRWPEAGRDCESLVIHGGYGWLVAKVRSNDQASTLARFALADTRDPIRLEVIGDLDISSPAAAADITPDGRLFAISSRAGVFFWDVHGDVAAAAGRPPVFLSSSPDEKKEGLSFVPQGLLIAAESRALFLETTPGVVPAAPEPSLDAGVTPAGVQLHWTAPYGVSCTLEHRERLDRGDWMPVSTEFPGLGVRSGWRSTLPTPAGGGDFFRLTTAP